MKLIIDIPEEVLNKLPEAELGSNVIEDVLEAVENGTPLPKGHGDLIDRDELLKNDVSRIMGFRECDIRNAHVVIEADRERSSE